MSTNALESIGRAAMLSCPITRIGTEKRANLVTDAPADAVVKREVVQIELQVVSSGKSLRLPDRLVTFIKSLDELQGFYF